MRAMVISLEDVVFSLETWGQLLGRISTSQACEAEVRTKSEGHAETTW